MSSPSSYPGVLESSLLDRMRGTQSSPVLAVKLRRRLGSISQSVMLSKGRATLTLSPSMTLAPGLTLCHPILHHHLHLHFVTHPNVLWMNHTSCSTSMPSACVTFEQLGAQSQSWLLDQQVMFRIQPRSAPRRVPRIVLRSMLSHRIFGVPDSQRIQSFSALITVQISMTLNPQLLNLQDPFHQMI